MSQLPAVIEDKVTALINTLRDSSLDNATYETAIALLQETAQEMMDFAADLKQELDRANDEIQVTYDILEGRDTLASNGQPLSTMQSRVLDLMRLRAAVEDGDTDHPEVAELFEMFEEYEAENFEMNGYYEELGEREQMGKAIENTAASLLNMSGQTPSQENILKAKRIAWALLGSRWNADGMFISLNAELRQIIAKMWNNLPSIEPDLVLPMDDDTAFNNFLRELADIEAELDEIEEE